MDHLALSLIAAVSSYWGVAAVRRWAVRHALDVPNPRSSHARPTPRGGGLAVVVAALGGWLGLGGLFPASAPWAVLLGYAVGAALVAGVSWLDDLHSLPAGPRLAAHVVAAAIAVVCLGSWETLTLPLGPTVALGNAGVVLTLAWIVGLTNAYNFMDGSDGIAGSQAVVAGVAWAALGWLGDEPLVTGLGLLLAAGSVGFLAHNWPPARVFLGDVGSVFLGYSFALMPLVALRSPTLAPASILLAALPVWPFAFDAAFTFGRRLLRGEKVWAAHRTHLFQRLLVAGRSHRFVLLLYAGLAMLGGVMAVLCVRWPTPATWAALATIPLAAAGLWTLVVRVERLAMAAPSDVLPLPSAGDRLRKAA
ncbi:MAG: glycosyltransferase family 4 protein [Thermoguttaceae bacterium]|jgi:UDP-N-acetylmuramyl pentapeptide phosphotransferase/UDP-N-acetylglucosamine-1-phosphate transferase|nr:glycosyltransferase family 4 protein [Thermoguttaceae bacterium]